MQKTDTREALEEAQQRGGMRMSGRAEIGIVCLGARRKTYDIYHCRLITGG